MNENKPLPKGWEVKKLEEIKTIEFLRGNGLPKSALNDSGKSECIHYGQLYTTYKHPVIKKVVFRTNIEGKRLSNKGDVLIPGTTTADAMGIAIARSLNVNNVVIGGDINILRTKNMDIFSDFLSYYLNGPAKVELASYANGTNILHLSNKKIKKILIPIPSLSEQKRIVAILDKTFAEITKAEAITKTNLQNAKELFESYLNNVFENKGDDWVSCELNDYVNFIDYRGRTPVKTTSGVRLITAKNIKLGHLQKKPEEFIATDNYESWMTRGIPNFGDIIFTTEAPLAHIAQINSKEKLAFAQRVIVMQPDPQKINQTFLKYLLLSNPIRNKILAQGTGATVLGIKSRLLKKIGIDFPKIIEEQDRIVERLNSLSAETKKLETIYQQKLTNLAELKKSILQKAFNGEL